MMHLGNGDMEDVVLLFVSFLCQVLEQYFFRLAAIFVTQQVTTCAIVWT